MHKIKKSLKPQNWFILLTLGLSSAFLLYGCVPTPTPPEKAPDFTLPDMEGNLFTLSEKEGQPVVLCFFKTDCPACIREVPYLNAIYQEYKNTHGLLVVGIAIGEPQDEVQNYIDTYGVEYPVLLDSQEEAADSYGIRSVPHLFFIDREGYTLKIEDYTGGLIDQNKLESYVQRII